MTLRSKMDVRGLVVIFALISLTRGLNPFIAWSNTDVLDGLEANDGLYTIASALADNKLLIDVVVVFGSDKLTFDDIIKYGNVFSKENNGGELDSLKLSLKSSKSQYWTGVDGISTEWIVNLANDMGKSAKIVNLEDLSDTNNIQGVIFIDLKEYTDLKSQDDVVHHIMDIIELSEKSFVAIYSEQMTEESVQVRVNREVGVVKRAASAFDDTANVNNTDCPLGGAFNCNATEYGPCFLICMSNENTVYVNVSGTAYNFTTANCTLTGIDAGNYTYGLFNGTTLNITYNGCKIDEDDNVDLFLQFRFPNVTDTGSNWKMEILMNQNESESWILERSHAPGRLYESMSVPSSLSYACSSPTSNTFTSFNSTEDYNVTIVFGWIMVQPYGTSQGVSSFASAYNCVGYFSYGTWMGIVSCAIIAFMLYIAIICSFSINSLDKFEDPRGKTISVEKLH